MIKTISSFSHDMIGDPRLQGLETGKKTFTSTLLLPPTSTVTPTTAPTTYAYRFYVLLLLLLCYTAIEYA